MSTRAFALPYVERQNILQQNQVLLRNKWMFYFKLNSIGKLLHALTQLLTMVNILWHVVATYKHSMKQYMYVIV